MPRIPGFTIYSKNALDLDKTEIGQLSRLASKYGDFSQYIEDVRDFLDEYLTMNRLKKDKIFILKENKSNRIKGWSLCKNYYGSEVFVYVATRYRRNGYGRELFNRAYNNSRRKHKSRRIGIYRHDNISTKFYDSVSYKKKVKNS